MKNELILTEWASRKKPLRTEFGSHAVLYQRLIKHVSLCTNKLKNSILLEFQNNCVWTSYETKEEMVQSRGMIKGDDCLYLMVELYIRKRKMCKQIVILRKTKEKVHEKDMTNLFSIVKAFLIFFYLSILKLKTFIN